MDWMKCFARENRTIEGIVKTMSWVILPGKLTIMFAFDLRGIDNMAEANMAIEGSTSKGSKDMLP